MSYDFNRNYIVYKFRGKTYPNKIVKLNFNYFIERGIGGFVTKWKRVVEIPYNYVDLLQGSWTMSSHPAHVLEDLKFKNRRVKLNDQKIYTYEVKGQEMVFTNVDTGVQFSQTVAHISEGYLALLSRDGAEILVFTKNENAETTP